MSECFSNSEKFWHLPQIYDEKLRNLEVMKKMFFCLSNKNKLSRLNLDLIRLTLDLTVSMRLSFLKRAINGLFLFIPILTAIKFYNK